VYDPLRQFLIATAGSLQHLCVQFPGPGPEIFYLEDEGLPLSHLKSLMFSFDSTFESLSEDLKLSHGTAGRSLMHSLSLWNGIPRPSNLEHLALNLLMLPEYDCRGMDRNGADLAAGVPSLQTLTLHIRDKAVLAAVRLRPQKYFPRLSKLGILRLEEFQEFF
jgi:hypothetical protein